MVGGVDKGLKMVVGAESLYFAAFLILNHADTFMDRYAIMESSGSSRHLNWTVWNDLWCFPAFFFSPVDREHVISENAAEFKVVLGDRLDLANVHFFNGQV